MNQNDVKEILDYLSESLSKKWLSYCDKKSRLAFADFFAKKRSFGVQTMYDFLIFQLNYWEYADKMKRFDGKIPLEWLIGQTAYRRWTLKSEHWKYYNDKYCEKHGLKTQWIVEEVVNIFELEEKERGRYFYTEKGLLHCLDHASYNKDSIYCVKCKYQEICCR